MNTYSVSIMLILFNGLLLLGLNTKKLNREIYVIVISLQLIIISGFRGMDVGNDTIGYARHLMRTSSLSLSELFETRSTEAGYLLFEFLISRLTSNPTIFFTIISTFYMISVGLLIYKNSSEPSMSFILFIGLTFFAFAMSGARQTMALGFIFFCFDFIKKKKLAPFLLFTFLAYMFHSSAFVFLPAYFIAHKQITRKYILTAFMLIPVTYVFIDQIFAFISDASGYDYSTYDSGGPVTLAGMMVMIFVGGIILLKNVLERNKNNTMLYNFSLVSILLVLPGFSNPSALRAAYYYHIFSVLFIPEIIFSLPDKKTRVIAYCAAIVGVTILYLRNLNPASPFFPYSFFWES